MIGNAQGSHLFFAPAKWKKVRKEKDTALEVKGIYQVPMYNDGIRVCYHPCRLSHISVLGNVVAYATLHYRTRSDH